MISRDWKEHSATNYIIFECKTHLEHTYSMHCTCLKKIHWFYGEQRFVLVQEWHTSKIHAYWCDNFYCGMVFFVAHTEKYWVNYSHELWSINYAPSSNIFAV